MPTEARTDGGGAGGGLLNLNITVDNAGNEKNVTSFKQEEITLMVLNNVGCCPHLNLNQSVASGLLISIRSTFTRRRSLKLFSIFPNWYIHHRLRMKPKYFKLGESVESTLLEQTESN